MGNKTSIEEYCDDQMRKVEKILAKTVIQDSGDYSNSDSDSD